jgi:peroxiredoxin
MQGDLRANDVRLVLASRSGAGANRELAEEHGLKCTILLMEDDSPLVRGAFQNQGTPVAYLLDEQGRVARPLAVGGDAIVALAREAIGDRPGARRRLPGERPLSESRIERNGLKAGTRAPTFRLPDLRGGTVALEDYRGRRVLLVFTDPDCGPCEELAPHLARLHRQHRDDPALLVVARGDVEENRRKADAHGFDFPVALQERWKLSKEYGIFAVPVAFLIDEEGVILRGVARGVREILDLFPSGATAGREVIRREGRCTAIGCSMTWPGR